MDKCRYIELFAGVGGFHVGLDRSDKDFYQCVMANQWEPGAKDQFAANIYRSRFPDDLLINDDVNNIKGGDYEVDLLMGGFPCQDYSVAKSKSSSMGIEGKKGVLWWQVIRLISEMPSKPKYLLFENVDRMIISPSRQRGRDFALIIQSLVNLGYNLEWRVINAAEYGMPQKRRRIFIFAFLKGEFKVFSPDSWLYSDGILAKAFPVKPNTEPGLWGLDGRKLDSDLVNLSNNFNKGNVLLNPFDNGGVVIDGLVYTDRLIPAYSGPYTTLGDILVTGEDRDYITDDYYISNEDLPKWQYAKGSKQIPRTNKEGYEYTYTEGAIAFPDPLDKPARTLITSEVSIVSNRFTHVIKDPVTGKLRRLVPVELERIQMFPDNHTEGITDKKRGFLMGNALVCGIVERIGKELKNRIWQPI
jgi:DNA (cytosine-5)-methyltransferase 1